VDWEADGWFVSWWGFFNIAVAPSDGCIEIAVILERGSQQIPSTSGHFTGTHALRGRIEKA